MMHGARRRGWRFAAVVGLVVANSLGGSLRLWAAEAVVGQPAPDFTLADLDGAARQLSTYRGRYVVLEWVNPECPFVRKHYGSGNMQRLQRTLTTDRHVVWFSIDSSAPGKQGHLTPEQAKAWAVEQQAVPTSILLDPDGRLGRLYGAKATPHMFVIDPQGVLMYAGAIDDRASADPADVHGATNYVERALDEVMAGKPVSVPETRPYGCSVKYSP